MPPPLLTHGTPSTGNGSSGGVTYTHYNAQTIVIVTQNHGWNRSKTKRNRERHREREKEKEIEIEMNINEKYMFIWLHEAKLGDWILLSFNSIFALVECVLYNCYQCYSCLWWHLWGCDRGSVFLVSWWQTIHLLHTIIKWNRKRKTTFKRFILFTLFYLDYAQYS